MSVTGQRYSPRPKTLTLLWEKDVGSKTTVTRQRKRTLRMLSPDVVCLSVCVHVGLSVHNICTDVLLGSVCGILSNEDGLLESERESYLGLAAAS